MRIAALVGLGLMVACGDAALDGVDGGAGVAALCSGDSPEQTRPAHWTEATHCKGAEPNYDLLFDDTAVQRIDITIAASDHAAMQDDLDDLLGGGGGPGMPPGSSEDPMWVPVTIAHDGREWTQVGMRYKGNSSLSSAYRSGIEKLSFRLGFDHYEDTYPELDDQRFHGFKKMTFSNGFNDPSLIRDKLAADIFRAGGVPAARGAFARIYVDVGNGPVYFGLYTMIEDPSNKLLDTQFTDDSGNLYKPENTGARWGTFSEADFEKKTNEEAADWSDVQAAISALNASRGDASSWRANLEATFDVAGFLRWLALNQAMVNWDTYGWMTHNYYLYGDPAQGGRLVWIPWDLNEALIQRSGGGPWSSSGSVLLDEITTQWPLIRYLLDDAVYAADYRAELAAAVAPGGAFEQASVAATMQAYHDLIAPYVSGADGEVAPFTFLSSGSAFDQSLTSGTSALLPHLETRQGAISTALD